MGSKPRGSPTPGQTELVKLPLPPPRGLQTPSPWRVQRRAWGGAGSTCFHRDSSQGLGSLPSREAGKTGISWPLSVLLLSRFLDVRHHNIDISLFLTEGRVSPAETPPPLSGPLSHCSERPGHCQPPSQSLVGTIQEG